jgi:hypothetical protein
MSTGEMNDRSKMAAHVERPADGMVTLQYCPEHVASAVAWLPVVLVDLTIVEFLVGLVAWYTANFGCWPAAMMSGQLGAMGLMSLFVAVYMGRMMHQDGSAGLGGGKEDVVVASGDKAAEVGK